MIPGVSWPPGIPLRCRVGWHPWGQWVEVTVTTPWVIGDHIWVMGDPARMLPQKILCQERTCQACGLKRIQKLLLPR